MFLQPAGVKDYTTLLLCSYSTTSAIQLSIEILGPLLSLRSLSAGVGERICTGQRPRGPLRLAGTGSKDRSFHANMRCDAMQSRLALAPRLRLRFPLPRFLPHTASAHRVPRIAKLFFLSHGAAAGRLLRRRTTAIRAHCPPPLIVQGSCRFRNASSRVCGTTSPPPQLSLRPASLSLSLSQLQLLSSLLAAAEAMAGGGGLYGLSAFNDLIHGCTLLYITSCPAAPPSISLPRFLL